MITPSGLTDATRDALMPETLRKAVGCLLTPIVVLLGLFWLCLFHGVQIAARHVGEPARRRSVDALNACLLGSLTFLGHRCRLTGDIPEPDGRPLIVIANHQSTLDVIGLGWYLRRWRPRFVAKRELGRGIPSVSYNLRHSGAALIDRGDARQAMKEIGRLGEQLRREGGAGIIFPEGTRARDGRLRPFAAAGIKVLLKKAPGARVLPVCIHDTWRLHPYGRFPMGVGERFHWSVLPVIETSALTAEEVVQQAEAAIRAEYARLATRSPR